MKRTTSKHSEKHTTRDKEVLPVDDTAWSNMMRDTLSPYWSARMEYTVPHRDTEDEANAA